jgi:hypothetical protein
MSVIEIANQDLKGITKIGQAHIDLLGKQVAESYTREELVSKIEAATKDAKIQFAVVTILMAMADEAGRYRGGNPELADQILDQQAAKVKKYGDKAYRLSEKQVMVIANSVWNWLKS